MIPLTCDHCDKSLRLRDELAGKRIKCPGCGGTLSVPFPDEEEVSPPPRAKAAAISSKPTRSARARDDDDDDDDDRPARKSKAEEDGPAKPHAIFLILGLLFGIGGLAAMAYFIVMAKFANDKVETQIKDKQHLLKIERPEYERLKNGGEFFKKDAAESKAKIEKIESEIENISSAEVTTNGIIAAAFGLVFLVGVGIRGYHFVQMKKWHAAHHGVGKKKKKRRDDEDDDD